MGPEETPGMYKVRPCLDGGVRKLGLGNFT